MPVGSAVPPWSTPSDALADDAAEYRKAVAAGGASAAKDIDVYGGADPRRWAEVTTQGPGDAEELYAEASGPRRIDLIEGMGHAFDPLALPAICAAVEWALGESRT